MRQKSIGILMRRKNLLMTLLFMMLVADSLSCSLVPSMILPAPVLIAHAQQPSSDLLVQENDSSRSVIPAKASARLVDSATMQRIYDEVKTPFKYGVVIKAEKPEEMVDCASLFRSGGHWYMMYVAFENAGYQTYLARSEDLLHWEKLGKILSFTKPDNWDAWQADGGVALCDYAWGGSAELEQFDGKYWLSYIGGPNQGYEPDPLSIGIAWTDDPTAAKEWNRLEKNPVLSPHQPDVRDFETQTLYKSQIIHDKTNSLGWPFVMFYNGKIKNGYEHIGMAVSKDMVNWVRYGRDPVIANGEEKKRGISGDPQIVRIGDVWVMFYFGAHWKPGAFDTFACSYDLVNWTKWEGPDLIAPSEPWDQKYAHKPWIIKHNGVVYHFYCAVGDKGRAIALATSKDLGRKPAQAKKHSPPPETGLLRLKVLKTLPQPVIGKNTPGAEKIPGGFEAGTTVKVTIKGKPEYHFFSHAWQTMDWSRPQLDHWFSRDGLKWQHGGALLTPRKDENTGWFCTYGHPTPFYVENEKRWYIFYSVFRNKKPGWVPQNTVVYSAKSSVAGPEGIYGPWDFPGKVAFVPGISSPSEKMVAVSISCPFQVKDGRWAIFFCPSIGEGDSVPIETAKNRWPVALSFGPSPTGPFTCPNPCLPVPVIDPPDMTENMLPIKVRGPKSGKDYWVAVFDFLAPEVSSFTPKNVFGFSWSADGVHWPKENGQVVNIDEGLPEGERGWWRGSSSVRTPHQMIDEGDGTYTIFFTGGSHVNHFADFRPVGMVKVKLLEE